MIVIRKKRKKILKKEKNQTHSRYNVNRDIDVGKSKWVYIIYYTRREVPLRSMVENRVYGTDCRNSREVVAML